MTTLLELMADIAREQHPQGVVIGLDDVRAFRWLAIARPVEAGIHTRVEGRKVKVIIDGYCEGTVLFADAYPEAPPVRPLEGDAPSITARELYDCRWMFHGPRFQGIVELGAIGEHGIRGVIEAGEARGALLDNAGQLLGYWVMDRAASDRMAMPVKIERLRYYRRAPAPGERIECTVHVKKLGEREVVADLALGDWARIEGWEDRRFDTDDRLWPVLQWPELNLLSTPHPDGFVVFDDRYRAAPTRDQLARRYLTEEERALYEKQPPREQRAWLARRIAAKDLIRNERWLRGDGPLFPVEVEAEVATAHHGDVTVAMRASKVAVGPSLDEGWPHTRRIGDLIVGWTGS
jgi:hypothetical protein